MARSSLVMALSPNDDKILTITWEGLSVLQRWCASLCKTENLITVTSLYLLDCLHLD